MLTPMTTLGRPYGSLTPAICDTRAQQMMGQPKANKTANSILNPHGGADE